LADNPGRQDVQPPWNVINVVLHTLRSPLPRRTLTVGLEQDGEWDGARFASPRRGMADPAKHPDLHGNAPDQCPAALIIVDVVNALRFDGGEAFAARAAVAGRHILDLKRRVKAERIPTIYVNDNVGRWRSDFRQVVEDCCRDDAPGKELTRMLVPDADDYVVLKPKHSGFYSTTLDTLLTYLRTRRVIITGMTIERCLLFTANDAFLRDYELFVPKDCTAAIDPKDEEPALRILERVLGADTRASSALDLTRLKE
jgi:nicotinamidase-related amidase